MTIEAALEFWEAGYHVICEDGDVAKDGIGLEEKQG